ncbi:MAG: glucose-6-phosphate isomerase [Anaerolineae bacterium]|nr:glucose-6-phosphate isomerase [Anaerolineae bacterium]
MDIDRLLSVFDPQTAAVQHGSVVNRYLSDLKGYYADPRAYEAASSGGNPLVYSVSSLEPGHEAGDLHFGVGMMLPGKIGNEYYLTKGHYHAWRAAAEYYIGLSGSGMVLLEDERTQETHLIPMTPNAVIYVPGYNAHRTINTGTVPLTYIGIFAANAGHDYGSIAERNFRHVVVEQDGQPVLIERQTYLASLGRA